ncbi:hypothetical protein ABZ468_54110 [Streptomyces sp. NPDC005708]|uniref:hypothetical protein n=1 Tax=unclassified Streptomyces TaxID=2593676 RepID=UPI0033E3734D
MFRTAARRWARALLVLGLAIGGVTATAPASYAGSSCTYPLCSETYNKSAYSAYVIHDWCGTSNYFYSNTPPCGVKSSDYYLQPGAHTDSHQDWDGFRVDAYWCYKVQWYSVLVGWEGTSTYDRRGNSVAEYVRVHNDETAYILSQSTSSC